MAKGPKSWVVQFQDKVLFRGPFRVAVQVYESTKDMLDLLGEENSVVVLYADPGSNIKGGFLHV